MAKSLHPDAHPQIQNYEDAFKYIVNKRTDVQVEQAIAFLLFSANLRRGVEQRESRFGIRISRDDTDQYIDEKYGTLELDHFIDKAEQHIKGLIEAARDLERKRLQREPYKKVAKDVLTGIASNVIIIVFGFIFGIAVALYGISGKDNSQTAENFGGFMRRCLAVDGSEIKKKDQQPPVVN